MFFDDSPALTPSQLRSKCRRLRLHNRLDLVVVDYLQLMASDGRFENRVQEVGYISRQLKVLARELDVPILAAAQLSRAVEMRTDKRPVLSDLRESGSIEQDADMVMFLYRPEYYNITANEFGDSNKGETHVRIAKHRNGSLETIKLKALLHIQKFTEMEGDDFGGIGMPQGSWKPVPADDGDNGARLFIQKGSKMNDGQFDDEAPF